MGRGSLRWMMGLVASRRWRAVPDGGAGWYCWILKVGLVWDGTWGGMGLIALGVVGRVCGLESLRSPVVMGCMFCSGPKLCSSLLLARRVLPPSKAAFRSEPFRFRGLVCCITDAMALLLARGLGGRPSAWGLVLMGDLGATSWRLWLPPKKGKDRMFPERLLLCPLMEAGASSDLALPFGLFSSPSWDELGLSSPLEAM